jgi:hypothetical protein
MKYSSRTTTQKISGALIGLGFCQCLSGILAWFLKDRLVHLLASLLPDVPEYRIALLANALVPLHIMIGLTLILWGLVRMRRTTTTR